MAVAGFVSMQKLFSVKLFGLIRAPVLLSASSSSSLQSFPASLVKFRRGGILSTGFKRQQPLENDNSFFFFSLSSVSCSNYGTSTSTDYSNEDDGTIGRGEKGFLELTDQELLGQCEMNTFKASGPGGQHRNKRESAVRLKHLPTGIIAQVYVYIYPTLFAFRV